MADVFISYSKADKAIAEALANDLKSRGFDVWWDFQLYAGDDFHDMIRAEIAQAKAVVVIWSETAVASRWVRGEAQEADDLGTLISTHAPGFDAKKVPLNFRALHCEPVANRDRVMASVERKAGKPRPPVASPTPQPADPHAALRARAESGDASAQVSLGYKYESGDGAEKDLAEAVRWYRRAAEQGDATGQKYLGFMYDNGRGVAKDEAEAVRWYRLAAEQGHAPAQHNLGFMYANGRGVAKDEAEAMRWYRRAAEQGYADAQSNLGFMYERGLGVAKDEAEAVRWYRLAAEQGHAPAQFNLGVMYANGQGVAKDEAAAVRWYRLAAEQGDEKAKKALARRGLK